MPDHLILGDQFIYGSTVNSNLDNIVDNIFIWRVNVVNGLLSEDSDALVAVQLVNGDNTASITGLKRSLDNDDIVHGIIFFPSPSWLLYYLIADLGSP